MNKPPNAQALTEIGSRKVKVICSYCRGYQDERVNEEINYDLRLKLKSGMIHVCTPCFKKVFDKVLKVKKGKK